MRLFLCVFFSLLLTKLAFAQEEATLSGQFTEGFPPTHLRLRWLPGANQPEAFLEVPIESQGVFYADIPLEKSTLVECSFGTSGQLTFFLAPKSEVKILLSGPDSLPEVQYEGDLVQENLYLLEQQCNLNTPSFRLYPEGYAEAPEAFLQRLKAREKLQEKSIKRLERKEDLHAKFLSLAEETRLFQQNLALLNYPQFHAYALGQPEEGFDLPENFFGFLGEEASSFSENALQTFTGRAFLRAWLEREYQEKYAKKFLQEYPESYLLRLSLCKKKLQGKALRMGLFLLLEEALAQGMHELVSDALADFQKRYSTGAPALWQALQNNREASRSTAPGKVLSQLNFLNERGDSFTLDSLRGYPIYLLCWAPWSAPSTEELQIFATLADDLIELPVHFVAVTLDGAVRPIEAGTKVHWWRYDGVGLTDLPKKLNAHSLPHFIMLDANGKVYQNHAPRPSQSKIEEQLAALIRSNSRPVK